MTRPIEVFNILQKKTKTLAHLKVDGAIEGCTGKLLNVLSSLRPSFMGIVFGSGILLDLVLFANRIIVEPKS